MDKETPKKSFLRPAFPGNGPKTADGVINRPYSPENATDRWDVPSDVREGATRAALERRCGFPSYLTNPSKGPPVKPT